MLTKIIISSLLIVGVLIIRGIFQNKVSTALMYAIWMVVAVRLLMPGMIMDSPLSIMHTNIWEAGSSLLAREYNRQDIEYKEQKYQEYYKKMMAEYARTAEEHGAADTEPKVADTEPQQVSIELKWHLAGTLFGKIIQIAQIIWMLGIVVFIFIFILQNLFLHKYLHKTRRKIKEISVGIRKIPVFMAGNQLDSPCLFGLFPAIYIPEGILTEKGTQREEQLTFILEHELTHYRHGDHIWSFVRILCLILNWYNPLVWIAARLSVRDGELACDVGCVRRLGEKQRYAYGEALIAMIKPAREREPLFKHATMMTSGKKFMKKRIENIAGVRKSSPVSIVAMLILLLLCVGCTCTGTDRKERGEETKSNTTDTLNAALNIRMVGDA